MIQTVRYDEWMDGRVDGWMDGWMVGEVSRDRKTKRRRD
jgi:hypothetical protein